MANKPSIKTLRQVFGDRAPEARKVLEMSRVQLEEHPVGAARVKECFHPPKSYDLRMTILDSICEGSFGYESAEVGEKFAEYLNVGEMYAPTLIRWQGRYRVQDLGTFIERNERRRKE